MLNLVEQIWKANPDWRLGQVVANAIRAHDGRVNCDPFYIDDRDMNHGLEALAEHYSK
jgi:hypothetical protein